MNRPAYQKQKGYWLAPLIGRSRPSQVRRELLSSASPLPELAEIA